MKINGVEFDLERAAYDIGQIAAQRVLETDQPLSDEQIMNMLSAYINTTAQVLQKSPESFEALPRW